MDITKFFNIEGEPSTTEEIEKKQLFYKKRVKILNWLYIGLILSVALLAIFALWQGETGLTIAAIVVIVFVYAMKIMSGEFTLFVEIVAIGIFLMSIAPCDNPEVEAFIMRIVSGLIIIFGPLIFYLEKQKDRLELFQPLSPEHAPNVITWSETDPVIAAYQNKVAAQGRIPIEGEYLAMKEWIGLAEKRFFSAEKKAKEKAEFEKLLKPIAYKGGK